MFTAILGMLIVSIGVGLVTLTPLSAIGLKIVGAAIGAVGIYLAIPD